MTEPPERPDDASGAASPLRFVFVIVPVLVILATAAALVSRWASRPEIQFESPWTDDAATRSGRPAADVAVEPDRDVVVIVPDADPPEPAFDLPAVLALVPAAEVSEGAARFRICSVCHTASRDDGHRLGPNLWGIVGRRKASQDGFRYSARLREIGGTWTYADLAAYLHNPRDFAPGTSMSFAGVRDPEKLAALLAYLRTLSDRPPPLPE